MKKTAMKLRSQAGLTLSEMLVTLLLLVLVLSGVATGLKASFDAYQDSVRLSDALMLSSTLSEAIMDEFRYAGDVETETVSEGGGTRENVVSYTSLSFGERQIMTVRKEASGDPGGYLVIAPKGTTESELASRGKLLVGTGAYARHLRVKDLTLTYEPGTATDNPLITVSYTVCSTMGTLDHTVEFSVYPQNM